MCLSNGKLSSNFFFFNLKLKGTQSKRSQQPWKHRKCENISFCRFCVIVLSISVQQKNSFLALNLNSSKCSHIGLLFTNEEKKKVGWWHLCHMWQPCSWGLRLRLPEMAMFSQLLNIDFEDTRPRIDRNTAVSLYSISINRAPVTVETHSYNQAVGLGKRWSHNRLITWLGLA